MPRSAAGFQRPPAFGGSRAKPWPSLITLCLFVVLISLGWWQVRRLAWKERLLAEFASAEQAPPVPLVEAPVPYQKVAVSGRLDTGHAAFYGSEVQDGARGPVLGAQAIVPLLRDGAPAVLVDLGWVPEGWHPGAGPALTVVGYVRPPEHPGMFSATDDPAGRRFYTMDPAAIGRGLGVTLAPFTIVVLGHGNVPPIPAEHLPQPPNDHLSYAITWFSLAAVLLVIYGSWMWKARRA